MSVSLRPEFPAHPNPVAKAIGLAVRGLLQLKVPRIAFDANDTDFEGRKALLEELATVLDPIFKAVADELRQHSDVIDPESFAGLIAKTLHDHCLLHQLTDAAEALREAEHEAAERPGSARARYALDEV